MSHEIQGKIADLMNNTMNMGVTVAAAAVPANCPTGYENVEVIIRADESNLPPIRGGGSFEIHCLSSQKGNSLCKACPIGRENGLSFNVQSYNLGPSDDHDSHG